MISNLSNDGLGQTNKMDAFDRMQLICKFCIPDNALVKFMKRTLKSTLPCIFVLSLCLVILWDMNKVHQLSEIIHDDHTDLWEQMNESSIATWFTPLDLCMLQINSSSIDVKMFRQRNCSDKQSGSGVVANRLFCGIGASLGKACPSPLSDRTFFTARLRDKHLGDPNSGVLKRTMRRLADAKRPIVFLGDAISKQNQEALLCEMLRTDKVWATGSTIGLIGSVSNYTLHWKDSPKRSIDVHFLHMSHIIARDRSTNKQYAYISDKENATDSNFSTSMDRTSYAKLKATSNNMSSKNLMSISLSFSEAKTIIEKIIEKSGSIVLIANVGVWYNSRERFRSEMPQLVRWLAKLGTVKNGNDVINTVLFRETSAQHWNHSDNGYFSLEGDSAKGSCTPLADSTPEFDWRNRDVRFTIENEKLHNIHIIPFHDVTAPLHDMHPASEVWEDCTHFCYFPQMWQGVFAQMDKVTSASAAKQRRKIRLRRK